MNFHFHVGAFDEAASLVERHHYSARPPMNIQCVGTWHENGGLFGDAGTCVAACFFSIPPTRWGEPALELSRLVRKPSVDRPLSGLIGITVRHLARGRFFDLLISFADATHGHHGGVYQAASWRYAGQRDRRMDGLLIDGSFVGGRACNHKFGTQSPVKLKERFPGRDIQPHFDMGKHLYWKATTKRGLAKAERLGLQSLSYPKPGRMQNAA